jgi:hypothetical protein
MFPDGTESAAQIGEAGQFSWSAATVARPVAVRPRMSKKSLLQAQ